MNSKPKISTPAPSKNTRRARKNRNLRRKGQVLGIPNAQSLPRRQLSNQMKSVSVVYSTGQSTPSPTVQASYGQSRIRHRELVTSITGTETFTVGYTLALNPGVQSTFNWLSTMAQGWEQYEFKSLKFEYVTRTSTSTSGSVMLVPDYDAADAAPVSEQVASSYEDTQEDVPWVDLCCTLNPSRMFPMGPKKFIRLTTLASNLDIKTYDAGNLFVCTTDGASSGANWGKLWVEYDVILYNPQLPPGGVVSGLSSARVVSSTPTSSSPFNSPSYGPGSNELIMSISGQNITFNIAGTYMITTLFFASAIEADSVVPSLGLTVLNQQDGGAGGTNFFSYAAVISTPVGGTFTFNLILTTGTLSQILVALVPSSQG